MKNQVIPLEDSILTRLISPKPTYTSEGTLFTHSDELSNVRSR